MQVLKNKHKISFKIDNNLDILHNQKNLCTNNILEELEIYNEVKMNSFKNVPIKCINRF